jgi:uncharacterized protein YeaO (DUF488 family)
MLYRAPVKALTSGTLSRRYSYTVVVMQYYPRYLKKEMVDEYLHDLAPPRELFTEFKKRDRETKNHDLAFQEVRYEERFVISDEGRAQLERLSQLSQERDVFLLCQCLANERCHADLLLLMARHWFKAKTQILRVSYPIFEKRLLEGEIYKD